MNPEENEQSIAQAPTNEFTFDKRVLWIALRKKLIWLIILSTIITACAFFLAQLFIVDQWTARSILIRSKKNMAQSQDMPYLYQDLDVQTVLETIKMRRNLETVIANLKLKQTPDQLFNQIEVVKKKSDIIHILVKGNKRDETVAIANQVASVFLDNYSVLQNTSARKIFNYYSGQKVLIIKTVQELDDKARAYLKSHQINNIESEATGKYDQLKEIEIKKIENEMLITEVQTRIAEIESKVNLLPDISQLYATVNSPPQRKINDLKKQLSELGTKYTPQNPKIISLNKQIAELEKDLKNSTQSTVDQSPDQVTLGPNQVKVGMQSDLMKLQGQLKASHQLKGQFEQTIAALKGGLDNLSHVEKDYWQIKRSLDMNTELLKKVESRIVESKMAMQSNMGDFNLLEKAIPPQWPESSGRKAIAIGLGIASLIISILAILVRELLDSRVRSLIDLKNRCGFSQVIQIPDQDEVSDDLFYPPVQTLIEFFSHSNSHEGRSFVTLGGDSPHTGSHFLTQKCIEILHIEKKKILYIESTNSDHPSIQDYKINDFLDADSQRIHLNPLKVNEGFDKVYFAIDSSLLRRRVDLNRIKSFIKTTEAYDFVFWKLFPYDRNPQLYRKIAKSADLNIILARFKHSQTRILTRICEDLNKEQCTHVAVLNKIPKDYFTT